MRLNTVERRKTGKNIRVNGYCRRCEKLTAFDFIYSWEIKATSQIIRSSTACQYVIISGKRFFFDGDNLTCGLLAHKCVKYVSECHVRCEQIGEFVAWMLDFNFEWVWWKKCHHLEVFIT